MTTLKERFEKYDYAVARCHNHKEYILTFIKQELMLLAEEVEKEDLTKRNWGVKEAASIIRTRADEI